MLTLSPTREGDRGADDPQPDDLRPVAVRTVPSSMVRALRVAIAVVLLAGIVALIFGPGRGLRADVASQRDLTEEQLALTRQQLDLTRQQLAIATDQRDVAHAQLGIAQQQLGIAQEQLDKMNESLGIQRRTLDDADATLQQAREVNEKTPDLTPDGR